MSDSILLSSLGSTKTFRQEVPKLCLLPTFGICGSTKACLRFSDIFRCLRHIIHTCHRTPLIDHTRRSFWGVNAVFRTSGSWNIHFDINLKFYGMQNTFLQFSDTSGCLTHIQYTCHRTPLINHTDFFILKKSVWPLKNFILNFFWRVVIEILILAYIWGLKPFRTHFCNFPTLPMVWVDVTSQIHVWEHP